jgi:mannosyltransferase OCH1-like enzyme
MSSGVPALIHQIWYNFESYGAERPIPSRYGGLRDSWMWRNPEYRVVVWTESSSERLLSRFYPEWLHKFRCYTAPIERVDFFRWVALYHFGGCYADMDCECRASVAEFLASRMTTTGTNKCPLLILPDSVWAANCFALATPKHPAVRRLIEHMVLTERPWFLAGPSAIGVFCTTGPAFVRRTLLGEPNVWVEPSLVWHLPNNRIPPKNAHILVIHHGHGAWGFARGVAVDVFQVVMLLMVAVLLLLLMSLIVRRGTAALLRYHYRCSSRSS